MTSETRFFRSDTDTVNGLLAYKLLTTNTVNGTSVLKEVAGNKASGSWRARVYKRDEFGTETLIGTSGSISWTRNAGVSQKTVAWACPLTALNVNDSIVVRIDLMLAGGAWEEKAVFSTERLNETQLDSATWTFYAWGECVYDVGTNTTGVIFYFGDSTYNSRITNFSHSTPAPPAARKALRNLLMEEEY